MLPLTLAKRTWLLVFLAVIALYLYGLGHLPLVGPDEPRYAQVAREMFLRGDPITPTLNGNLWFEKPVLLYWMIMVSYRLFGDSEWAIRLGPALSGLLTIAGVYWLGRRVERVSSDSEVSGLGTWWALVTATAIAIIVFSSAASFDIVVTMTVTLSLCFFFAWELQAPAERSRWFLIGFYVFVGVSLLAKGLVGFVVPFGVVGAFYLLRRELPGRDLFYSLWWGLPLAILVAAIWYGPVIARHGWYFIEEFFLNHHFRRYLSDKYRHSQPVYFYAAILLPMTLPWAAFIIDGLINARNWKWRSVLPEDRIRVFGFAWLLLPLVFFSFSESKLPGYILPAIPGATLIAGDRLTRFISGNPAGIRSVQATGLIFILFALGGVGFAQKSGMPSIACAFTVALPLTAAGLFALVKPQLRPTGPIILVLTVLVGVAITLNCGVERLANRESVRRLIKIAEQHGYGASRLYMLHEVDRTAEFYAAGQLVYGEDGNPLKVEGPEQVANTARSIEGTLLVITPVEHTEQLTKLASIQAEVLGDNGRLAIVAVSGRMKDE